MIAIHKGAEPRELTEYRAQPGAVYDGENFTPVKSAIREQLLRDQGHLCAYCMQRITIEMMRVEHWHCQDRYPSEQLNYRNLLGCCTGNQGAPSKDEHCDKRKGNTDISINPADPDHYSRMQIRYDGSGVIRSENASFDREINQPILNLNRERFKNNRKAVLDSIMDALSRRPGQRTRTEIESYIGKWQQRDRANCFKEYCGVALYYLRKKLNTLIEV